MSKTRYTYIKHNGTWKQPKNVLIKQSGAWTQCKGIYTKVQGEWVLVWPSQVAVMTISTDLVQINSSLNTTSDKQKVIITNSGDADLRITDITPSTPTKFTINIDATGLGGTPSIGTPRTIAPGTSKSFEISITSALLDGTDSGTVTITAFNNVLNATTTQDVTVSGTIDVLDASVRVDKSSVSLTTGVTKKSSAAKITVTNNGTDNLNITSLTTTGVPSLFTIEFNTTGLGGAPSVGTPRTIAPGSSKSFEVTITGGNSPGSDSGVVTLGYLINQLGDSDTTTINVNGSVSLSTAILTPSPEALSFGSVTVNTETRKSLVLKNTGSDVLTVNSISATNPSFITLDQKSVAAGGIGPTLPTTIDAGKSKTIDVIVNASTAGASSGTITIGYTKDILGTTASTTVAVTATGVNLITGFYEITPSPINVTVKNGAQVDLPIIKILNKGQTAINNTTLTFTKPSQWVYSGASGVAGQGPLTNPLGSGVAYELEVFVTGAAVGTGGGSITFTGTATGGGTVTGQCVINVTVEASANKEPPPVVVEALPIVWFDDDPDKDGNPYLEFNSNDEQSQNIILKNTGTAPVTVIKITDDQGSTGGAYGGQILFDLDSSASYTISKEVTTGGYASFGFNIPDPKFGFTTIAVFGKPAAVTASSTRTITTKQRLVLSGISALNFKVAAGTTATWGDPPDSNTEALHLEYSLDNGTWENIVTINPTDVSGGQWSEFVSAVPSGAKGSTGVFLRYRQARSGDLDIRDNWAMTSIAAAGTATSEWFLGATNVPGTIPAGGTASFGIKKKALTPATTLTRNVKFTFQEQTTNVNNKYTHPSIVKGIRIVKQEGAAAAPSGTVDLVAPAGFPATGGAYVAYWTPPPGVSVVRAILIAGGAGGAAGLEGDPYVNGGGGGGAGEVIATRINVTPGVAVQFKIGAGGQGAVASYGGVPSKPYASRGGNTEFFGTSGKVVAQGGYAPDAGIYGGNRRPIGGRTGGQSQSGYDGAIVVSESSTLDAVVMRGGAGGSVNVTGYGAAITGTGGTEGAGGQIDWYLNGAVSDAYGSLAKTYGIFKGLRTNKQQWIGSATFYSTSAGTYTIEYAVDNEANISIIEDDSKDIKLSLPGLGTNYKTAIIKTFYLKAATKHVVQFDIKNTGYNGIIAILIKDPAAVSLWSTRELANNGTTPQGPGYVKGAQNGGNATGFGAGGGGGNGRSMGSDDYVHGSGGNGAPGMIRLIWPPS